MRKPTSEEKYIEDLKPGTIFCVAYPKRSGVAPKLPEELLFVKQIGGSASALIIIAQSVMAHQLWNYRLDDTLHVVKETYPLEIYSTKILDRSDLPLFMNWYKGKNFETIVKREEIL